MSLLDDANEIARHSLETLTVTGTMVCVFCGHAVCRENCVREALPRIVAALEAIALLDNDEYWRHGEWCGPGVPGDIARYALGLPIEDWSRAAIMAALKGNAPPA